MSNRWQDQALDRLEKELKDGKAVDRHSSVMAEPVAEALREFCRQEEEFAQAIVQGGTFADCMKAVSKGVSSALSDLEAYRRAVRFYFPGAEVRFQMRVDLVGDAAPDTGGRERPAGLLLNLTDFL